MKPFTGILFALVLAFCHPQGLHAQTYTVSVSSASLGTIVSAASGTTTFRVDDNLGTVTTVSGTAARITTGAVSPIVASVTCLGTTSSCNKNVNISIASAGTPTNRASSLTNFTATADTASFNSSPSGTNPVTFRLNPIARNATVTFFVGYDFPVRADNSGAGTGLSSSSLSVTASASGATTGTNSGTASATVIRSITLSNSATLSFGRIVLPSSGSRTVTYSPTVRTVQLSGSGTGGATMSSPAPSLAAFSVAGEGGQSFTLTVPSSFTLSGPSGSTVTITTLPSVTGAQTLSGSLGASGSLGFTVGGSFAMSATTQAGAYSGNFSATVQYN
ncbi:MAG: DUF4402 domain-containing protein [Sphingomonadales bacterium]|nr:DUF4402 domain-containing protein [Sphingomonadales bacterium]